MNLYVASSAGKSVVVAGGNRKQALRVANDYFGDLRLPAASSVVKMDMPDTARVIYTVPQ